MRIPPKVDNFLKILLINNHQILTNINLYLRSENMKYISESKPETAETEYLDPIEFIDSLAKLTGIPIEAPPVETEDVVVTYYEIDSLNLPTRIRNCCIANGIVTIEQLKKAYENGSLCTLRGLGPAALNTIRQKLIDPDLPLPKRNDISTLHLQQLQLLRKHSIEEKDDASLSALNWAISLLQKKCI